MDRDTEPAIAERDSSLEADAAIARARWGECACCGQALPRRGLSYCTRCQPHDADAAGATHCQQTEQ